MSEVKQRTAGRQGRPRRLSHEAVLDAALELLGDMPLQEFTLAKLAQKLGASTMSLYTYYASRDELLDAVAERAFQLFRAPEPKGRWQKRVLDWLWALQRHVDRYPITIQLMARNGHLPMAWLGVWAPILKLMHEHGLEGKRLAETFDWFINAAVGLIITQRSATEISKSFAIGDLGAFPLEDGMLVLRLLHDLKSVDRETRFTLGFRRIVEGLETCIAEATGNGD
ncbi:MAG TPA: TetR family transcriptional regulator [Alphaproteobacteria bacterium]|nr:TetR family transcriptional regulator [Alphaproteobacteria bacterium]